MQNFAVYRKLGTEKEEKVLFMYLKIFKQFVLLKYFSYLCT